MNAALSAGGIAYLDTTAIVSLYVQEPHTALMRDAVERFSSAATSRIAYAETRAVFARMRRERALRPGLYAATVALFNEQWTRFGLVEIVEPIVRAAGDLIEKYPLRGFDALHLASALRLRGDEGGVIFCCHDARLAAAARAEGLAIVP